MTVTVCVPVWNGAAFVAETLESLRQQTLADFQVLIADDCSDDNSVAICRSFEGDPRFSVVAHPERGGWIRNVNSLLDRVESPLACIMPHDDLPAPEYLERLVESLASHPAAMLAYSDLETFGNRSSTARQESVQGTTFDRLQTFLREHVAAVGWRGVFRTTVLAAGMRHLNEPKADTIWLLQLATRGELIRVPEVLYRKRVHDASARSQPEWQLPSRHINWIDHCVACYRVAMAAEDWTPPERQAIAAAALSRLFTFDDPSHESASAGVPPDFVVLASHFFLRAEGSIPHGSAPLVATTPPKLRGWRRRGSPRHRESSGESPVEITILET